MLLEDGVVAEDLGRATTLAGRGHSLHRLPQLPLQLNDPNLPLQSGELSLSVDSTLLRQ